MLYMEQSKNKNEIRSDTRFHRSLKRQAQGSHQRRICPVYYEANVLAIILTNSTQQMKRGNEI